MIEKVSVWNNETQKWEHISLKRDECVDYPYTYCPPPPPLTDEDWAMAMEQEEVVFAEEILF